MKKTTLFVLLTSAFLALASCEKKCNCNDEYTPPKGTFCYADEGRQKEMLKYPEVVSMLRNYDTTRIAPLEEALGYPDSRVNTYGFKQFKKYLGHIENLSKKAKIEIAGISFIYAAKPNYKGTGKSYQDLIYIPTTLVKGVEVPFDPVQSVKQGRVVTFKEMLAENGYKWIYNTKEDFEKGKRKDNKYLVPVNNKKGASLIDALNISEDSGAGNFAHLSPPY